MGIARACETFTKAATRAQFKLAVVEGQNEAFVYLGHALEQWLGPRGGQHGNVAVGTRALEQNKEALRHEHVANPRCADNEYFVRRGDFGLQRLIGERLFLPLARIGQVH